MNIVESHLGKTLTSLGCSRHVHKCAGIPIDNIQANKQM